MKKLSVTAFLLILQLAVFACPVCEKQQPKILRGISHGTGPQSNWDYVIVSATAIIVAITLLYSIKYLIKPREKDINHIKRTVIN